ncbi:MAG TPA: hypothetical protein PKL15_08520 [Saprospiraceae bacterium]|nr:hypothetical protein [Saprospiraceae bacterium]
MKYSYQKFIELVEDELDSQSKFGFFVRGLEFQEESKLKINEIIKLIIKNKKFYIKKNDEKKANGLLAYQFFAEGILSEISMIVEIKNENISAAWDYLVDAQGCIQASLRIGFEKEEMLKNYLSRLLATEKLLFPPQIFASMGFVVEKSRCSLCNCDYGECNHIKGMAYMGEMCVERIEKIHKLEEVSIVDNPVDKRCRALSIDDKGIKRDIFTWRQVE